MPDELMVSKASEEVLRAALAWFFEMQKRPKDGPPLTPAEETLRVAVFMLRKSRSVSGQFSLEDAKAQLAQLARDRDEKK